MLMRTMPAIDRAICEDSYEWLIDNCPGLAQAVIDEVRAGASPEQIRGHVLRLVGAGREPLALRCQQAAAFVADGKKAS